MFRRSPESDGRHAPAGRFLTALRLLSVTALLLADREPVSAQTSTVQLAQTHKGASAGDQLGWAVASVGDLDGDGFFDIIVGAPNAGGKGQALVFSGKDGTQLFVAQDNGAGGGPANAAGRSVAGPGDLNSDGTPDVLLGNPQDKASSANDGRVNLISGISHSSLHVWTNPGPGTGGVFGWDVDAGDADLDGTPDILIADPQTGNGDTGRVVAYTGASPFNSVIFSTSSPQADALGWSIAASLDLDGAGTDLIAGAPLYDVPAGPASAGRFATFHVAPPGQQVLGAAGTSAGAMGGTAVAMIDDANGDGKPDIVIGFPGPSADLVRVFDGHINGVNGPLSIAVATGTPGTSFGAALASAGDFDGDGDGDFIVGAPLADVGAADVGAAEIRSGSTGALLATLPVPPGMASAQFGYSVACAGDINGDGLLDYVVGAPFADLNGTNSGAAFVFATVPPPPPPSYDPGHNLLEGRPGAPTIVTLPVVLPIAGPGDDLDLEPVVIVPKTSGTTVVAEVAFAHLSGAYFQSVGEFPCTTGSGGPQQVAGGEFTGDLKPDVLAVNQADDNFSLLAGTNVDASQDPPQGLQLQPVTFPVSPAIGTLIGIRAANLNGDTRTDAVVAGFDGVQPFTQDAPGHFAPGAEVTIQHVTGFAVGNIDTNSADDVVIVSGGTDGTGQATSLINNGTGVLGSPHVFGTGAYVSVVLGNFVAGGGLDALLVRHLITGEAVFELYSNPGSGIFATPAVFNATLPATNGVVPTYGVAGDVNGDTLTDAVFTSNDNLLTPAGDGVQPPLSVTLLTNGGPSGGNFTLSSIPTAYVGRGVEPLVSEDLDGNGLKDIVLVWYADQDAGAGASGTGLEAFVAALVNGIDGNPPGTFSDPAPNQFGAGSEPGDGDTGNVNDSAGVTGPGDAPVPAAVDIVLPNAAGNSVTALLGDGTGGVAGTVVSSNVDSAPLGGGWSGGPRDARLADLNGDGHLDVVTYSIWTKTQSPGEAHVRTRLGDGTGAFAAKGMASPSMPGEMALGDMNLDGHLDVVVTSRLGTNPEQVQVFLGDGSGALSAAVDTAATVLLSGGLVVSDVDLDGRPDVLTTAKDPTPGANGWLEMYPNVLAGPQGFTLNAPVASQTTAPWTDVSSLLLGDIDVDGLRDALVGVASGDLVAARGALHGNFVAFPPDTLDAAAAVAGGGAMALGNLNGDMLNGKVLSDLVCATGSAAGAALVNELLGVAGGNFTVQHVDGLSATSDGQPTRPLLVDFNGDEATDLILVHGEANSVSVLLNELAAFTTIPAGKPGKGGAQPTLAGKGYAVLGGPIKLVVAHGTGGALGMLYLHYNPTGVAPAGGGVLAFNYAGLSALFYFPLGGTSGSVGGGSFTLSTTIPVETRFEGLAFDAQVLIFDPIPGSQAPSKFAVTNGLTVQIQ